MAIQGYSMYIAPACDNKDINPEYNAQQIKTITVGEATKEGDVWRITKKALIELV
jgi:hypothetical protein